MSLFVLYQASFSYKYNVELETYRCCCDQPLVPLRRLQRVAHTIANSFIYPDCWCNDVTSSTDDPPHDDVPPSLDVCEWSLDIREWSLDIRERHSCRSSGSKDTVLGRSFVWDMMGCPDDGGGFNGGHGGFDASMGSLQTGAWGCGLIGWEPKLNDDPPSLFPPDPTPSWMLTQPPTVRRGGRS